VKPITLEALLSLEEAEIRDLFPHGAREHERKGKPPRYSPAESGEKAAKTLKRLLREKQDRIDKPRFPVASGPQRLRWSAKEKKWVPKEFTPDEEHGYTSNASRSLEPADAIPPDVQSRYSDEARERFVGAERPLSERVKDLEGRLRGPQMASLYRRVEALERVARNKAA
jgi:hypothetical protein